MWTTITPAVCGVTARSSVSKLTENVAGSTSATFTIPPANITRRGCGEERVSRHQHLAALDAMHAQRCLDRGATIANSDRVFCPAVFGEALLELGRVRALRNLSGR